ncbi:DMT family transporter [Planotetraspora sp. GP83]|uniref:DMT family transporter n=1 Tax=Planotetraspora sp. GP83 TaxID=3156264 RepID=UPI003514FD00
MIAVPLALLAAACNAIASVLQRRAARTAPASEAFRLTLILDLIRRPSWLGGILALTGGFVFQAAALGFGGLSLVQPLLVTELPIAMVLGAWTFRFPVRPVTWLAVGILTSGLAMFLIAAGPAEGHEVPETYVWWLAAVVTAGLVAVVVATARLSRGEPRAALLGVAAALAFAFTAALMKETIRILTEDPPAVLTSWFFYSMVAAGLCSVFLLQNAFQSGTLVAVQPALTVTDPVASILFGVALFGEDVRSGPWVVPEALGIGLILYGSVLLSRSTADLVRAQQVTQTGSREETRRRQS